MPGTPEEASVLGGRERPDPDAVAERARWIKACALAETADLEEFLDSLPSWPAYCRLRGPEIGLALVRGRIGGDGRTFNVGEMTVTRCTVRLNLTPDTADRDILGHGYVAGRKQRHAELAAVVDGVCQADLEARVRAGTVLIEPVLARQTARAAKVRNESDATKVDFFTMVRGD